MGIALARAEPVADRASRLGGAVDATVRAGRVTHLVAPADAARDTDLLMLTSPRHLPAALAATGVILCAEELAARLPDGRRWVHSHAMWVMARLLDEVSADDGAPAVQAKRISRRA